MITATAYDTLVEKLFARLHMLHSALTAAEIPYRIVGGMAAFLHVSHIDPDRGRLTRDIDVGIQREHLDAIRRALAPHGFVHRHVAGVDMLVDAENPRAGSALHFVFLGERVRPQELESIPASEPVRSEEGFFLASIADLVRMKLISFRLKDKVHIQDLDGVGLITPEIEVQLTTELRARLAEVRATE